MKTTMEERSWNGVRANDRDHEWAAGCSTVGVALWAGIAVLSRIGGVRVGAIELLFLFAPLVIVPLGMELGRRLDGSDSLKELARRLQPVGAGLAVIAIVLAPGRNAAVAALGWVVVCVLMAGSSVAQLLRALWSGAERSTRAIRIVIGIAGIDLFVGGVWLVASRWGMQPLGIGEPIALLTAVHFHFAGFATAMIAAATLQFAKRRGEGRWLKYLVLIVAGAPIVVAAAFLISPVVKMVAAVMFSASVAGLAIVLRASGRKMQDAAARLLLQVAAGAIFVGMMFAGAYALADYLGRGGLTIAQMTQSHGILNGVGFCLPGLLGWLVEGSSSQ
jgi:hypothetical protein